jgi:hypothetical protein
LGSPYPGLPPWAKNVSRSAAKTIAGRDLNQGRMLMRLYRYVGPKWIAERARPEPTGVPIRSPGDVRTWVRDTGQDLTAGCVIVTFVINASGELLVADRHSEHVACADGAAVRSAGEMTFAIGRTVEVVGVSNQSTGYCPEPESWPAVAEALGRAGLAVPDGFSLACVFRRCGSCSGLTLVKANVFECGGCGAELSAPYNVQEPMWA